MISGSYLRLVDQEDQGGRGSPGGRRGLEDLGFLQFPSRPEDHTDHHIDNISNTVFVRVSLTKWLRLILIQLWIQTHRCENNNSVPGIQHFPRNLVTLHGGKLQIEDWERCSKFSRHDFVTEPKEHMIPRQMSPSPVYPSSLGGRSDLYSLRGLVLLSDPSHPDKPSHSLRSTTTQTADTAIQLW